MSLADTFRRAIVKAFGLEKVAITSEVPTTGSRAKVQTWAATSGGMSAEQLRNIYMRSSTVRACVDAITRQVTTLPWIVTGDAGAVREVQEFLEDPNPNEENFAGILDKVVRDLLVLDVGVIEKVFSPAGKLVELWARDAATFKVHIDEHGVVQSYTQEVFGQKVEFAPNELIYIVLHPRSNKVVGTPIIESIVDEVAAQMFAISDIAKSFDEDEIPPGILHLGQIGEEAYKRAKQEFEQSPRSSARRRLKVIANVETVNWIQLKRPYNERQAAELLQMVQRIIYRNFGLTPVDLGETEGVARATAVVQERIGRSRLIEPLARKLEMYINRQIVRPLVGDKAKFQFVLKSLSDEWRVARAERERVFSGLITINDVRRAHGLPPLEGGDEPFVVLGRSAIRLRDLFAREA